MYEDIFELVTIADVDDSLTAKKLVGIMPETYNHYYGALRLMYKRVLKLNWDEDEIPGMKQALRNMDITFPLR